MNCLMSETSEGILDGRFCFFCFEGIECVSFVVGRPLFSNFEAHELCRSAASASALPGNAGNVRHGDLQGRVVK